MISIIFSHELEILLNCPSSNPNKGKLTNWDRGLAVEIGRHHTWYEEGHHISPLHSCSELITYRKETIPIFGGKSWVLWCKFDSSPVTIQYDLYYTEYNKGLLFNWQAKSEETEEGCWVHFSSSELIFMCLKSQARSVAIKV